MIKDSEQTKEHNCVFDIFKEKGPLSFILNKKESKDGIWAEIKVDGPKVSIVRESLIYCIQRMNMDIEIFPHIDDEDNISATNFTLM